MATSGYHQASIQAIAKTAGLAPGLIHYHFKNKQEILTALIFQLSDIAKTRYRNICKTDLSTRNQLHAFIDAALLQNDTAEPYAVTAWVMITTEAIRQHEVKVIYQNVVDSSLKELKYILNQLVLEEKHDFTKQQIEGLAATIYSCIEGAFQLSASAAEVMPKNYAASSLKALIDAYLPKN